MVKTDNFENRIKLMEKNGVDTTKEIGKVLATAMSDSKMEDCLRDDYHDTVVAFVGHGDFKTMLLRYEEFIKKNYEEIKRFDMDYKLNAVYVRKHLCLISTALISLAGAIGKEKFNSHTKVKTANYKCKRGISDADIDALGIKAYLKMWQKNVSITLKEISRAIKKDTLEAYDVLVADAYSLSGDTTHAEIYIKFHIM